MQSAERLEAIARQCRTRYNPYPESLITAICQYASGAGSLAAIQQEWQAAGKRTKLWSEFFIVISDPNAEQLDEMDLRVLDICMATGTVSAFLARIAEAGPVEQAYTYLLSQSIDKHRLLKELIEVSSFVDKNEQITALGRLIITLIPEHSGEMLGILAQGPWVHSSLPFIKLLLAEHPAGYVDLAEQVARAAQQQRNFSYLIGECAALLVRHDYARFGEWARQIAGPSSPAESARITALQALMECGLAANIDLAIDAAHVPPGRHRWNRAELQRVGIDAAYRLDPEKYLPLVEEAAAAPNPYLGKFAVELLQRSDFEQARPILQRCVASGDSEAALKALDVLLEHQWPERQAYLLSLLPHRAKAVRDVLANSLVQEGERIIEPLTPYLAYPNADTRLTTVQAMQRIGGEQVRALLAARLDVEKSLKVKQAMLDVVGVGALADAAEAAAAAPGDALTAEAEAALKRITKPALPWFDDAHMPGLRWKDGSPVPQVILSYLLYLQSRVKLSRLDERVQQALPLLDRGSAGDLALAIFNGWSSHGAVSAEAWCLSFACALADERLIHPLRQSIDGWARGVRGAIAARAVAALALIESDLALAEINDLAERARHSQVKAAAKQALTDAAAHRQITLEELADRIVPTLGFDAHGERVFDYGPRQFTARLMLNQTIQMSDSAGKRLTTLPKPGTRDDESKTKAALIAWSPLKRQVSQVVKMQAQRLEDALITQRAWDVARWQALFLNHPLLRSFATALVWGVVTPGQADYQAIFRPLEDGSLTDADDNAVTLPTEGSIRLAHPVELDEAARRAWAQHLADYEVTPPFPQVNRPILRVGAEECAALWWETYRGYVMNGAALKGRSIKAGWGRGSVQDGGVYSTLWKEFPDAGVQAILEMSGMSVGYEQEFNTAIIRLAFARVDTIKRGSYVYDDLKDHDERIVKLGDVPPIVFSEVAADVQTFAAAGEYTEDWEHKVW